MDASTALAIALAFGPAPKVAQPAQPAVMRFATKTVVAHQYSATHTHQCNNANCKFRKEYGEPFVWNHSQVAGHNCPYCGVQQLYQSGRPTTVVRTVQVEVNAVPARVPPAVAPVVRPPAKPAVRLSGG